MGSHTLKQWFTAAAMMLLMPCSASAAGLGNITVRSNLGQALHAEVELIAVQKNETLTASLGSADTYQQANVPFNPSLVGGRVTVEKRPNGQLFLKATTPRPINEPFIELLIQINSENGRLTRQYTVLLDPPGYGRAAGEISPRVAAAPEPDRLAREPSAPRATVPPAYSPGSRAAKGSPRKAARRKGARKAVQTAPERTSSRMRSDRASAKEASSVRERALAQANERAMQAAKAKDTPAPVERPMPATATLQPEAVEIPAAPQQPAPRPPEPLAMVKPPPTAAPRQPLASCAVVDPQLQGAYTGDCKDGYAEGFGDARGKATYTGEFKVGRKHGQGLKIFPNGDRYEGQFVEDRKEGKGTYAWGSLSAFPGERYSGDWLNDKRHGQGVYEWPNGDRYTGPWLNDNIAGPPTPGMIARARAQAERLAAVGKPGTRVCRELRVGSVTDDVIRGTVLARNGESIRVRIDVPGRFDHTIGNQAIVKGVTIDDSLSSWSPCV